MNTLATLHEISAPETQLRFSRKLQDIVPDELDAVTERHRLVQDGKRLGPVLPFEHLNRSINGYLSRGIHVVHGGPAVGKTAWAVQVSCGCECPALYVSMETPASGILHRIATRVSHEKQPEMGIKIGQCRDGSLTPERAADVLASAEASARNLHILDGLASKETITPDLLEQAIGEVKSYNHNEPHLLVVVDSLHKWIRSQRSERGTYDDLNRYLYELESMAARCRCSILVIAERSRAAMENEDGQHSMSAGAGGAGIEYTGEMVMALDTKRVGKGRETPRIVDVKAEIAKSRIGGVGEYALRFNRESQTFFEG